MTLQDRITQDIANAMKARETRRGSAAPHGQSRDDERERRKGRDLEDAEAQQVLASLIKQRRDSIEQFAGGRTTDLVDRRKAPKSRCSKPYAPPPLDRGRARQRAVDAAIQETGRRFPEGHGTRDESRDGRLAGRCVGRQERSANS